MAEPLLCHNPYLFSKVLFSGLSPVPKTTATCSLDTGSIAAGQLAEFRDKDKQIRWVIKKFVGGTELSLRAKISLVSPATGTVRREIGPGPAPRRRDFRRGSILG